MLHGICMPFFPYALCRNDHWLWDYLFKSIVDSQVCVSLWKSIVSKAPCIWAMAHSICDVRPLFIPLQFDAFLNLQGHVSLRFMGGKGPVYLMRKINWSVWLIKTQRQLLSIQGEIFFPLKSYIPYSNEKLLQWRYAYMFKWRSVLSWFCVSWLSSHSCSCNWSENEEDRIQPPCGYNL